MELKEIFETQKKFDAKHGWSWDVEDEKEILERLKYVAIALNGEAGEFANALKKSIREDFPHGKMPEKEKLEDLKEEIVDIFIYTVLASQTLKMNLEEEYLKKMKKLEDRFKNFEK